MLERVADYDPDYGYDGLGDRRGFAARVLSAVMRRRTITAIVIGVAAAAIVTNVVFLQGGDHPAPLFAGSGDNESAEAEPAPANVVDDDGIGRILETRSVPAPQIGVAAASAEIAEVQRQLSDLGYDPGIVDGLFGSRTGAAIAAFQTDFGLEPTGQVNDEFLTALGSRMADADVGTPTFASAESQLLAIQTALNQSGFGPVQATGSMSSETSAAIREFQLIYGLSVTGAIDQPLIDRMVSIGALEPAAR